MKFRMIFLGAEQDPEGRTVPELDADIPVDESSPRCYEYSGTHIVRRDQLANGRVRRTPVANFRARIVRDIIRDDGDQQQREFGLTLKYGGTVSGLWKVLYILDTWPDDGEPPNITIWSGGQLMDAILTAMHGLRTIMGRPQNWVGITPLVIFRSTEGWRPPTVKE